MPTRRNIIDLDHSCLSNATWEAAIKSIPMSRKSIHVLDMCVGLHDVCTYMRLQKKSIEKSFPRVGFLLKFNYWSARSYLMISIFLVYCIRWSSIIK